MELLALAVLLPVGALGVAVRVEEVEVPSDRGQERREEEQPHQARAQIEQTLEPPAGPMAPPRARQRSVGRHCAKMSRSSSHCSCMKN